MTLQLFLVVFLLDPRARLLQGMASGVRRIGLMLYGLAMLLVGGPMMALLAIGWELITRPFTFFKKTPRSGELVLHSVTQCH